MHARCTSYILSSVPYLAMERMEREWNGMDIEVNANTLSSFEICLSLLLTLLPRTIDTFTFDSLPTDTVTSELPPGGWSWSHEYNYRNENTEIKILRQDDNWMMTTRLGWSGRWKDE
jgi:hypothetical protein